MCKKKLENLALTPPWPCWYSGLLNTSPLFKYQYFLRKHFFIDFSCKFRGNLPRWLFLLQMLYKLTTKNFLRVHRYWKREPFGALLLNPKTSSKTPNFVASMLTTGLNGHFCVWHNCLMLLAKNTVWFPPTRVINSSPVVTYCIYKGKIILHFPTTFNNLTGLRHVGKTHERKNIIIIFN